MTEPQSDRVTDTQGYSVYGLAKFFFSGLIFRTNKWTFTEKCYLHVYQNSVATNSKVLMFKTTTNVIFNNCNKMYNT